MINLLFTISFILITYLISFAIKANDSNIAFFNKEHTSTLKGIAILLVVLNHLGGSFGIRYLTPLGGIGVSIFLIVSGYGLNESLKKKGLKNYWINKFLKVYLPYFIIQTFIFMTQIFKTVTLKDYVLDMLFIKNNHPIGWYLQFLLVWYIIFFTVNRIESLVKYKAIIYIVISGIFLFFSNQLWAEQAFSFSLGIIISMYNNQSAKNTMLSESKLLTFSLFLIGIIFLGLKQIDFVRTLPYMIVNMIQLLIKLPLGIAIILFAYQFRFLFKNNYFKKIGRYSYEIYLVHGYTFLLFEYTDFLEIVFFFLLTIIFALILHFFSGYIQRKII